MRKPFMVLPWALAALLLLQTAAGSNENDDDITFDDVPTRPEGPGRPPDSDRGSLLHNVYARVKRGLFDLFDFGTTTTPTTPTLSREETTVPSKATVRPSTSVSSGTSHREIRSTLSGEGTTSSDRFRNNDDEDLGLSSGSGAEWNEGFLRGQMQPEKEKYTVFRVKMYVQEFWVNDYKDKRSLTYENFVKNFTTALVSFFDDKANGKPVLRGKRHATVIGIEPSEDDTMLIHVTVDLGSKGTSNEEERIIKEQLTNTITALGRLEPFTVKADANHPLSIQRFTVPSPTGYSPCQAHELVCNDGITCLSMATRCNGRNECSDGTDEEGCPDLSGQGANAGFAGQKLDRCDDLILCPDGVTRICSLLVCDGVQQCPGESEEKECLTEVPIEEITSPPLPTTSTTTEAANCLTGEFMCDVNRCIPVSKRCDNHRDCIDGTDEDMDCPAKSCPANQFQCGNGKCIDSELKCNGEADCSNGSDEADCDKPCDPPDFKCNNGTCIPASLKCDGVKNCPGGEDERGPDCPTELARCHSIEFRCNNGQCINEQFKCDNITDCHDGSDEDKSLCEAATCLSDDFKCQDTGKCIRQDQYCDGTFDCQDGSDENDCPKSACTYHEYECESGQCIEASLRCNGYRDCQDGTDENYCGDSVETCSSDEFKCRDSGKCIQKGLYCDGNNDCDDGSDESDCPESSCRNNEYECENGQCVDASLRCNGYQDCNDGTDEKDCQDSACQANQFKCGSGECVSNDAKCNKIEDCSDGSDELNCILNEIRLVTSPTSQEIRETKEAVFQCRDEGPSRYRVRWLRRDGQPLPVGSRTINNGARLEIPNVQMSATGAYVCEAVGAPRFVEGVQTTVHLKVLPHIHIPDRFPEIICAYDEATCYNRQCVPKSKVCDGEVDCSDGSDESRCGGAVCEANMFMCKNRECIMKTWRCDNQKDCLDGSDEEGCEVYKNGTCYTTEFACSSGNQCIPKGMLCDKQKDCADNSDEIGCRDPEIVEPPQPIVTLQPGDQLILRCRAIGFPIPIINWRLNWGHVPKKCSMTSNEGLGTLECPDIRYEDSGAYSCEAINVRSTFAIPDANVIVKEQRPAACQPGYFNDEVRSPEDCINCFCFGKTSNCRSAEVTTVKMPVPTEPFHLVLIMFEPEIIINSGESSPVQSYRIPLGNGFQISSRYGGNETQYNYYSLPDEMFRPRNRYPTSPMTIPYKGTITYRVKPGGNTRRPYIDIPDVVIQGNNRTLTYKLESPLVRDRENDVSVSFSEGNWKVTHPQEGRYNDYARREDIMMVLVNIDHILIRVEYIEGPGIETAITDIFIDTVANSSSEGSRTPYVEQCSCPEGYTGLSCEECARDYIRQPGNYLGQCVKNDVCPPRTYGAPARGIRCRPCPCPTANYPGTYSTCSLGPRNQPICDCRPGYVGEKCERCDKERGYEGDARVGDCQIREATCSLNGSISPYPSNSGQCDCKELVTGTYCDECAQESFYLSSNNQYGCISCFCMGITKECSSSNLYRDAIETYFDGRSTHNFHLNRRISDQPSPNDRKQPLPDPSNREIYYNDFDNDVYYWELPGIYLFNKVTSYGGYLTYTIRYTPAPGGISSKNSAPDVQINSANKITLFHYSKQTIEPEQTVTVTVPLLEQHWQGEYGQQTDRATMLQALADITGIYIKATYTTSTYRASLSNVKLDTTSESNTGLSQALEVEQCQCLPPYKGTSCEDCAPGYTRAEDGIYLGVCERCECGGFSDDCDPDTGACYNCRDNREGDKCQDCARNFTLSNDGQCRPSLSCSCDQRWTRTCHEGRCICTGNVEGESCNRCRSGTFHLSTDNPFGCEECYCSGVTTTCYSSSLFMESVPVPILNANHGYSMSDGSRVVISDGFVENAAISELGYPIRGRQSRLFWSLPSRLTGDKVLSYGGTLAFTRRYTIEGDSADTTADHDIIISGNGRSIFYIFDERLQPNEPRSEVVKISAGLWRVEDRNSGNPIASRHDILKVLSNVDHILIRASVASNIDYSYISDVSLETASDNSFEKQPAEQIEVCRCPPEYSGTSCQNCAEDHYRDSENRCVKCPCVNGRGCLLINEDEVKCNCYSGWQGSLCDVRVSPKSQSSGEAQPMIKMTVSVSPEGYIPEGSKVLLTCTAEPASSLPIEKIVWSREGGNLPSYAYDDLQGILTINRVITSDSGVYLCTARTRDAAETNSVILTVNPEVSRPPIISITPSSRVEVLEGREINVRCEAGGYPLPSIEWRRVDGQAFNEENDNRDGQIRISSARKSDEGQYECIASNLAGTDSVYVQIFVREIVGNLIVSPRDVRVWPGQSVSLRCSLERPSDSIILQWSRNDRRQFPGGAQEENGELTIPNVEPKDAGEYLCTAIRASDNHKVSEAKAYITVHRYTSGEPLKVTVTPSRLSVNEGDSVTIQCVSSIQDATIQWSRVRGGLSRKAQVIDGLLKIHNVDKSDSAMYRCDARIGNTAATGTVFLEVKRRGIAPVIELSQRNLVLLEGNSHFSECRAQGAQSTVRWTRRNGPFSRHVVQERNLIRFQAVSLNDADEYICTAENNAGRTSATLVLEVHSRPRIRTSPSEEDVAKTVGESLRLICEATGVPAPLVRWEITTQSASESRIASNSAGETGQAIFEINSLSLEDEGTYTCTAYSSAGTVHKSINVQVIDNNVEPGVPSRKTFEVELGGSTRIDCLHPDSELTYDWERTDGAPMGRSASTNGPLLLISNAEMSDAGDYVCKVTDRNGVPQSGSIATLRVVERFNIRLRPESQTVYPGDNAFITCEVIGDRPADIVWQGVHRDLPPSATVINGRITFNRITEADAGKYSCVAIDRETNYRVTSTARVTVKQHYDRTIDAPRVVRVGDENVNITEGGSTILQCTTNIPNAKISWEKQGLEVFPSHIGAGPGGHDLILKTVYPQDSGIYICRAYSSTGGGSGSAFFNLNVYRCSGPGKKACKDGKKCLSITQFCNGIYDCLDRSDELSCSRRKRNNGAVAPRVYIEPSVDRIRVGETVDLRCKSAGVFGMDQTTWEKVGERIADNVDINEELLKIKEVTPENAGLYRCWVRNQNNEVVEDTYNLEVQDNSYVEPPRKHTSVKRLAEKTKTVTVYEPVDIECDTGLEPPVNFIWTRRSGQLLVNQTGPKIHLSSVLPTDAGEYLCIASNGEVKIEFPTFLIVKGTIPRFTQQSVSYLKLKPMAGAGYMKFDLLLSIKPERANGLILYNGERNSKRDFLAIGLRNGRVEFRFDVGSGEAIITSNASVPMGKWSNITVRRERKEGRLWVNGKGPFIGTSPGRYQGLDLSEPMYLGSVPNFTAISPAAGFSSGFVGCISFLKINDRVEELLRALEKSDVSECNTCSDSQCRNNGVCQEHPNERGYQCLCPRGFTGDDCQATGGTSACYTGLCNDGKCINTPGSYKCQCRLGTAGENCELKTKVVTPFFRGESFLAYPIPHTASDFSLNMDVKLDDARNALLAYAGQSYNGHGNFVALIIRDQQIEFTVDAGSGPETIRNPHRLTPGSWVKIRANKKAEELSLTVNGDESDKMLDARKSRGYKKVLNLHTPLYIGGFDDTLISLHPSIYIKEGFHGCISLLRINERPPTHLIKGAVESSNIEQCPGSDLYNRDDTESCGERNCQNGGYCDYSEGAPVCKCSADFGGNSCEINTNKCGRNPNPCGSNGVCYSEKTSSEGFRCDCFFGYVGSTCQDRTSITTDATFRRDSYVELPGRLTQQFEPEDEIAISMTVQTEESIGLIFWQGNDLQYMSIGVHDGLIVAEVDHNDNPLNLRSRDRVDDALPHNVTVILKASDLEITLDGVKVATTNGQPPRQMSSKESIFIGGLPDTWTTTNGRWKETFVGCIIRLRINNDEPIDFSKFHISGRNVRSCPSSYRSNPSAFGFLLNNETK